MLNLLVKALKILPFLLILLSGCLEGEDVNLGTEAEQALGNPVSSEEFCQRLEVVDPTQIRKHELPVPLQSFRDHCRSLLKNRTEEFVSNDSSFLCYLTWNQNSDPENTAIESFLDDLEGAGFTEMLKNQGNLDGVSETQSLIFSVDALDSATLIWRKDQLWERLTSEVPDLESLSWRLGFQHNNNVVCSPQAKWEKQSTQIILRNVEKCYGGGLAFNDTYTFDLSGKLLDLDQKDSDISCP